MGVNIYTDLLNTHGTLKTNPGLKSHIPDKKGRSLTGSASPLQTWTVHWWWMFPVKKTVVEMFEPTACLVCGFMAVSNILQV